MIIELVLPAVILVTNMSPPLREIGAYFFEFDSSKRSEVWVNLEPAGLQPGPNPVQLNVTVSFAGKRTEDAPAIAQLRAESIGGRFPLQIRQPIFRLKFDAGADFDLAAPEYSFQFISNCFECPLDTVVATVPFSVIRRLAASGAVIEALGFSMRLQPADVTALRRFVDTLSEGVEIR